MNNRLLRKMIEEHRPVFIDYRNLESIRKLMPNIKQMTNIKNSNKIELENYPGEAKMHIKSPGDRFHPMPHNSLHVKPAHLKISIRTGITKL
jgi:hypothetical protein